MIVVAKTSLNGCQKLLQCCVVAETERTQRALQSDGFDQFAHLWRGYAIRPIHHCARAAPEKRDTLRGVVSTWGYNTMLP